jgi:hypothetical protein
MSRTAFTIKASCCYIIALGLALVVAPNLVLATLRMPATSDVWIRVLGVVVINIGVFFWVAARTEAVALFHASVIVRPLALLWFGAFVLLGFASPMLLLFGVIEVAGALWTWWALHSDRKAGRPAHPASRIDPKYESRM